MNREKVRIEIINSESSIGYAIQIVGTECWLNAFVNLIAAKRYCLDLECTGYFSFEGRETE